MSIKQNITSLQNLLEQVNALPEEVILPELTNQAEASELFLNKELIDGNGNKVTGTFTIDSELSEQDDLIAQIVTALEGKAGSSGAVETCSITNVRNFGGEEYGEPVDVLYTDVNFSPQLKHLKSGETITNVPKNSIVGVFGSILNVPVIDSGEYEETEYYGGGINVEGPIFFIKSDITIG